MRKAINRIMIPVSIILALCIATFAWSVLYPSPTDPKNIKYVLWKAGLYRMSPELATGAMVGDPKRDQLVVGKTRADIERRFGTLVTAAETTPYIRQCYEASSWSREKVLFIPNSSWMIVFIGDQASKLVLFKGC